jgi:hypothetical protein
MDLLEAMNWAVPVNAAVNVLMPTLFGTISVQKATPLVSVVPVHWALPSEKDTTVPGTRASGLTEPLINDALTVTG